MPICYYCMGNMASGEEICPHCGRKIGEISQPEYALRLGKILYGKYLIGAILGQGGFGITYIGYDLLLEIKVAIKEYYPSNMVTRSRSGTVLWNANGSLKEKGCNSFLKEARKMARLMDIPEVVRVREILQENDTAYIVMDFAEGITLKEKLKRDGRMSVGEVADLLGPIADALDKVHKHGLIHRDISPDNIMIGPDGKAKLLDLGAAKEVDLRSDRDVQSSELIHKDGFSPPEQYTEGGNIGPWTDVYAMSATFYYCVAGKVVPQAIDRLLYNREAIEFPPSFSEPVRKVMEKGLSVRIEDRYQTMGEFWDALRKAVPGPVPSPEPPKPPESPKPPEPPVSPKPLKWLPILIGIAAAALAAAGIVFVIRQNGNAGSDIPMTTPAEVDVESISPGSIEDIPVTTPAEVDIESISPGSIEDIPVTTSAETEPPTTEPAEIAAVSDEDGSIVVGNIVTFGSYEQDGNTADGTEAIEWIVLDVEEEEGKTLVISRYGLDSQPYHTAFEEVSWENCYLREWLNRTFFSEAFNEEEQGHIRTEGVSADPNPEYAAVSSGKETEDRIFLLSIAEAETYFASDEERKCEASGYAAAQGAEIDSLGSICFWWLRTSGDYGQYAAGVGADGQIYCNGDTVVSETDAVRPALWVDLDFLNSVG